MDINEELTRLEEQYEQGKHLMMQVQAEKADLAQKEQTVATSLLRLEGSMLTLRRLGAQSAGSKTPVTSETESVEGTVQ